MFVCVNIFVCIKKLINEIDVINFTPPIYMQFNSVFNSLQFIFMSVPSVLISEWQCLMTEAGMLIEVVLNM